MANDLSEYLPKRHRPENVNAKHKKGLRLQDRIALLITAAIGTMYAVYFFAIFMVSWMIWQTYNHKPFDPYPFAFLLFIGNIIQLLLMPLIMVGQNIQGRHSELRTEEEFKTTETVYHDVEKILSGLDRLDGEVRRQGQLLEDLIKKQKSN